MGRLERFVPHALGVAIFVAIAGIAVAPTVDATRSSARAVPKKPAQTAAERVASQLSELVTTTTADPKLDPTPTAPPPADLGSTIADVSDLGFLRLVDPQYDTAFDISSLPGTSTATRTTRLTREGFTRGWIRGMRTEQLLLLEVDVYEFTTNAGAAAEVTYLRSVIDGDPSATPVELPDQPGAAGFRIDRVESGVTYHQLVLGAASGARFYRVLLTSSASLPDQDLGATILARQGTA